MLLSILLSIIALVLILIWTQSRQKTRILARIEKQQVAPDHYTPSPGVIALAHSGKRIEAIKLYRSETGADMDMVQEHLIPVLKNTLGNNGRTSLAEWIFVVILSVVIVLGVCIWWFDLKLF